MILLDTTVLVQYLRTASAAIRAILDAERGAVCGVTRAELLHGAKSDEDASRVAKALDCLVQLPIDEEAWDDLGHNLRVLRARGLTVPFPDALIATVAVRTNLPLWTYDTHFNTIRSALPALKLFEGPRI